MSGLVKITPARKRVTVVSEDLIAGNNGAFYKQIDTAGGREIVYAKLSAGGNAAACRIMDVKDIASQIAGGGYKFSDGFLLDARSSTSDDFRPTQPCPMKNGIAVVFEQGDPGNAEVVLLIN